MAKWKKDQTKDTLTVGDTVHTSDGQELVVDEVLSDDEFVAHTPQEQPAEVVERQWSVQDAARQMIVGYQQGWWAGIRAQANNQALGETASESACRACFLRWGAKLR